MDILNNAAERSRTRPITAGDELDDVASIALRVREITTKPAGVARVLYPDLGVRLLQLVWCDKDGAYPGDEAWTYGDLQETTTA